MAKITCSFVLRVVVVGILLVIGLIFTGIQVQEYRHSSNMYLLENRFRSSEFCTKTTPNLIEGDGYVWELLTSTAEYEPRDGAGGIFHNGKFYLLGGWNHRDKVNFPRITNNEVWQSDDARHWNLIKPNTFLDDSFDPFKDWEGRHTSGFISYKGEMWIIGGDASQKRHQHDIWKSKDGKDWQLVNDGKAVPWKPRALHITFVLNDRIFVVGGQTMTRMATLEPNTGEHYYNDVWSTEDGKAWTKHEAIGPIWSPRGGIGGQVVFKGKVWIVGGFVNENDIVKERVVRTDIWSSPDAVHWTKESDNAEWSKDGGLMYHDMAVFDDRLWIIGGARTVPIKGEHNVNHLWSSPDGRKWTKLKCSPIARTHATTVYSFPDRLVVASGNHMTKEVWELRVKR